MDSAPGGLRWEPAVYEHKAALISRSPAEVSASADLLVGMLTDEPAAIRVLEFAIEIAASWLAAIRDAGHDAIVFDSSASPPLLSPDLYRSAIAPLYARLMSVLAASGQREQPLVLGGDTTDIVSALLGAGVTSIVCDYSADAGSFATAIANAVGSSGAAVFARVPLPVVSRNVDPRHLVAPPEPGGLSEFVSELRTLAATPCSVVVGTGILPYGQDPANVVDFLEELGRECSR